jgi:response regulator RpfG family c-di-GMP phosphodiesterase
VAIRNAQLIASIKNLFAALVQYSASAIDARSPHTAGHSRRVAGLSLALADALNRQTDGPYAEIQFTNEEIEELSYAAWLHDVGKIGVKEQVLEKANKLSDTRMELIHTRFERIDLAVSLDCQNRLLALYRSDENVTAAAAALEEEKERQLARLEQDLALVVKINAPGWVSDEELARIEEIAALTYRDSDGQMRPYLTEFELKNLSVRKGNLTLEEYREIQSHVIHTQNILANIPFTPELARIPVFAAAHHEMLNGTGYPQGLTGPDIPLQARIIGVADIFDALVAKDRPYKKAMPIDRALNILREEAETGRLDSGLVDLFIKEEIWTRPVADSLIVKDDYLESQDKEC